MIIKNKDTSYSGGLRQIAGEKQEQDVAFFLRRAYKDDQKIFVFNDLRFEFNEEVAQIDHLILYPYGFVLIESKSITGEVKVNNNQEWTRSYRQQWSGMRSPIKQIELQEKLLRDLLYDNRNKILPKFLFGILQQGFGGRCWDQVCAVSSNAIVHRDEMPEDISKKLVKSEFLVDKLTKLMNIPTNKIISALKAGDSRPAFSPESMENISDFLMQQHKPISAEQVPQVSHEIPEFLTNSTLQTEPKLDTIEATKSEYIAYTEDQSTIQAPVTTPKLACKKCNNTEQLQAAWGKFGYYIKCPSCGTNTAMKQHCPDCSSHNTKISKKKAYYHLICQDCNARHEVFIQN